MTTFQIIEARPYHCGQMARLLHSEGHPASVELGIPLTHRELRESFDICSFRRAWLIDGELAALLGVCGTALSPSGYLWLALSEKARRYPLAVVKESRRQMAQVMATYRDVAATIIAGTVQNERRDVRFATFLGFSIERDKIVLPRGHCVLTARYKFREAA